MTTGGLERRGPGARRSGSRSKEAGSIQVLDRAIGIMEAVSAVDGMTLTSIAHQTGTTTSTAHRILTTLETNGLVTMDRERKLWFIGVTAFQIGNGFSAQSQGGRHRPTAHARPQERDRRIGQSRDRG